MITVLPTLSQQHHNTRMQNCQMLEKRSCRVNADKQQKRNKKQGTHRRRHGGGNGLTVNLQVYSLYTDPTARLQGV